MEEIREFYQKKYKVPMKEDIIGDTSGIYQKLCLYLANKKNFTIHILLR